MLSDSEAPVQGPPPSARSKSVPAQAKELKKLGKYQIERKLGAGGMGAVYLARDNELRRVVALKVLPKDKAQNPTLVRRFRAEAQAAAQLRHDNIVAVYDHNEADGYLYIAMEYVDGIDLHELVNRRGPISVRRSIEIVKQVASALQHAHEHKIVHRDIKPSNLLIRRDGVVKLTDLGLARSVDDSIETGITRAGTTVGTVDYMAPEQARSSQAADIRSDIYSLGCTWYHMLTGGPPFPEGSLTNKLQAHATQPPPDPRLINPQVTEGLVAVLNRMMAKRPEDRYQTPAELLKDLEGSVLTHQAFSQEILSAIEEESAEAVETSAAADRVTKSGPSPLPPPSRKRPRDDREEQPGGFDFELIKRGLVVAGLAGVVVFLGWLVWSFGGLLESPQQVAHPQIDPFAGQSQPVSVAPVGGATGMPPVGESTTPVAPVFGTADSMLQPAGTPGATATPLGSPATSATMPSPDVSANLPGGATLPATASGTSTPGETGTPGGTSTPGGTGIPGGAGNLPGTGPRMGFAGDGAPRSLAAAPFHPTQLPAWATPAARQAAQQSARTLRTLTVGPGVPKGTHYNSLMDALTHVGGDGAVIHLTGNGPYVIDQPVSLAARRLVINVAEKRQPVVIFARSAEGIGSLKLNDGTLEVSGVHFSAPSTANTTAVLLAVRDGAAIISDCSFTIGGPKPSGSREPVGDDITVLLLEGAMGGGSRLWLERTVIRGHVQTALDLRSSWVEAIVQDSLIAAGEGTVVRLSAGTKPGPVAAVGQPLRSFKAFSSTLASEGRMIDLSADHALEAPPPTALSFVNSICCTAGSEGPRVFVHAAGWRQDPLRDMCTWTMQHTICLGFQDVVDLGGPSALRVKDGDGWRVFWRQKIDPKTFSDEVWPVGNTVSDGTSLAEFHPSSLPDPVRKLGLSGEPPGVDTAHLRLPEAESAERMATLAQRRLMPPQAQLSVGDKVALRVDLRKEDLGQVLSRGDWPDGAVIEAMGNGICMMSPAHLVRRSVHVVFRQSAEGAPLRIQPSDRWKEVEALFRVEQGALTLDGLRWQGPDARPNVPAWLVAAHDANVLLRNCELLGPERAASPYQGVIRFQTAPAASGTPPYLVVSNCFIHAPGTLVRVDAGPGTVFVRESLLVARGTAFDVQPRAVGSELPLIIDLANATLAANDTVFLWKAVSLDQPPRLPARVFADRVVFGPPFPLRAGDASQPTLFTYAGPVLEQQQVEWWGLANGVSPLIKYLIRKDGSLPTPDKANAEVWLNTWGPGREVRLLTQTDGVMLAEEKLPLKREALRPRSYALHASSKGVVWDHGRPIGADVSLLDQIGPDVVPAPPSTKTDGANKKAIPKPRPIPKTGGF
uniref:non-specific serine/threonine protein kinase n=1 Tax=Schlesneria paludicola TaxID=360056 RepID=A0A7C4QP07_9PLAN